MLDADDLAAAPETPASVTVEAVALPDVSGNADAPVAAEAPPVVAEAAPAPESEEMAGLRSRLEQSEAENAHLREQLALHAAAPTAPHPLDGFIAHIVGLVKAELHL